MAEEHDSWVSNPIIGVSFSGVLDSIGNAAAGTFGGTDDAQAGGTHSADTGSDASQTAAAANTPSAPTIQKQVKTDFIAQKGEEDCKTTANAMAKKAGVTSGPSSLGIEIANTSDSKGRITIDPKRAEEGRNYIDNQLAGDKPVVVGVSHSEQGTEEKNRDKITDHYVLITGRGTDEKGRVFYTFKDPAGNQAKGDDTNPSNRFFVDENGKMVKAGNEGPTDEKGKRVDVIDRNYEVSLVVGNASLEGQVPASANAPENADIRLVRDALRKAGNKPADSGAWCKKDSDALFQYQKDAGLLDQDGNPIGNANRIESIRPRGISPGDGTDRSLLGGFRNKPQESFAAPKPTDNPTPVPAPDASDDGGLLKTLKAAGQTLEEGAESLVSSGKELLQDASRWVEAQRNSSKPGPAAPPSPPQPKTLALRGSVGAKGKNGPADVNALQEAFFVLGLYSPSSDQCDDSLNKVISDFQRRMKTVLVDGTVDPGGKTEQAINKALSAL